MSKKFVNFDTDDSISKYFKDVRKSVILTPKEEVELAKKINEGDQSAIDKLVNANLKFVVSIAKEYQGQGLSLSDLINEGNYGLIKAATRFDHKKGFRFISYAVWWVKQSIIQSLNDNARMVRLPANVISKISYLKKEIAKFENENERQPCTKSLLVPSQNGADDGAAVFRTDLKMRHPRRSGRGEHGGYARAQPIGSIGVRVPSCASSTSAASSSRSSR
jgi:RNA polymerase sigma factor (sigma-70 family)